MIPVTRRLVGPALALGLAVAALILLAVGVPTAVIPTPPFMRLSPTRPQDYVVLALAVMLAAALGASHALPAPYVRPRSVRVIGETLAALVWATFLASLAVGCPTCNTMVVRMFGEHGALTTFQSLQPVLAGAALLLLGGALVRRLPPVARAGRQGAFHVRPLRRVLSSTDGPARRWRFWRMVVVPLALVGILALVLRPAHQTTSAQAAPDFTLPVASGGHGALTLHHLRGHVVLLNFFNSHCPPCIAEMPLLRRTARTYRARGVIVLGVATGGDTRATARQFARAEHVAYPVVADEHQDVAWRYTVGAGRPASSWMHRSASVTTAMVPWMPRPSAPAWPRPGRSAVPAAAPSRPSRSGGSPSGLGRPPPRMPGWARMSSTRRRAPLPRLPCATSAAS